MRISKIKSNYTPDGGAEQCACRHANASAIIRHDTDVLVPAKEKRATGKRANKLAVALNRVKILAVPIHPPGGACLIFENEPKSSNPTFRSYRHWSGEPIRVFDESLGMTEQGYMVIIASPRHTELARYVKSAQSSGRT
jgi:hypothetical protein